MYSIHLCIRVRIFNQPTNQQRNEQDKNLFFIFFSFRLLRILYIEQNFLSFIYLSVIIVFCTIWIEFEKVRRKQQRRFPTPSTKKNDDANDDNKIRPIQFLMFVHWILDERFNLSLCVCVCVKKWKTSIFLHCSKIKRKGSFPSFFSQHTHLLISFFSY